MAGEHHPQGGLGVDRSDDIAMHVGPHLLGKSQRVLANHFLNRPFKAGRAERRLEKMRGRSFHRKLTAGAQDLLTVMQPLGGWPNGQRPPPGAHRRRVDQASHEMGENGPSCNPAEAGANRKRTLLECVLLSKSQTHGINMIVTAT